MSSEQVSLVTSTSQFSQTVNRAKIVYPALVFNRTPNRERINTFNNGGRPQTPVMTAKRNFQEYRVHSPQGQLRSSKAFDLDSMGGSRCTNKENMDNGNHKNCTNHQQKAGKYEVMGENGEQLVYCEKCAILLASQGFKVHKMGK